MLSNFKAHFWNAEKKPPQNHISHDKLAINLKFSNFKIGKMLPDSYLKVGTPPSSSIPE